MTTSSERQGHVPPGSPRSTPTTATGRSHVVDIARGLAIIGVVFNHAVDGLVGSGSLDRNGVLGQVNAGLYILRMPALLFLVGLFLPQGTEKHRPVPYLRRRVTLLLYLLVVWQLIQGSVELLTQGVRNGSTSVSGVLTLWHPIAHLWFLPFLALATIVCVVLRPWCGSAARRVVLTGSLAVVSVATWGWDVRILGLNGSGLTIFMVLGALVGLHRTSFLDGVRSGWAALVLAVSLTCFVVLVRTGLAPATMPDPVDVPVRLLSILAALVGIVALFCTAVLLSKVAVARSAFSFLGRATLPVYLAHVIVVAGVRVVLSRLGSGPELVLVVAVPLALAVPLFLDRLGRGNVVGWLFRIPSPSRDLPGRGSRSSGGGAHVAIPRSRRRPAPTAHGAPGADRDRPAQGSALGG